MDYIFFNHEITLKEDSVLFKVVRRDTFSLKCDDLETDKDGQR